jgi:superfamily II DNA or RNA helicase
MVELYPWQKKHASKLKNFLETKGFAKDGSDTGTGKTVVAIKTVKDLGLLPFVICPKAVVPNWSQWVTELYPNLTADVVHNYEKLKGGRTQYVKRKGKGFEWQLNRDKMVLIFDEDHYCKGEKSLNAKMLIAAKRQGYKILCLGATSCSSPLDLKALGYVLELHNATDFWNWCLHNKCRRGLWGGLEYCGNQNDLKKLHDKVYAYGSRIKISDLPPGTFPENLVMVNKYDVDDKESINYYYDSLLDDVNPNYEDYVEEWDDDEDDERLEITKILDERRMIEELKVDLFCDLAREYIDGGNAAVVFVNFRETLHRLHNQMLTCHGIYPEVIHGGQSNRERVDAINRFQSNRAKMMIVTIQSGGVGINLHDTLGNLPRRVIISPTFSAVDLKQALGRCFRSGTKSPVIQNIVFAAGTIEEHVYRSVKAKVKNIDQINDKDVTPSLT